MGQRLHTGRKLAASLLLGAALLGALGLVGFLVRSRPSAKEPAPKPASGPRSLHGEEMANALRHGDANAAEELQRLAACAPGTSLPALTEAEAISWVELLNALRTGYLQQPARGKAAAQEATAGILARFQVESTPAGWSKILAPSFDILNAGLADTHPAVRLAALDILRRLWVWSPGCSMTPAEEAAVGSWKERLYPGVVDALAVVRPAESGSEISPAQAALQVQVRQKAIACLAALPIDDKAAPALALLGDENVAIRLAVLTNFASRSALLTEEAILPLLHDPVPEMAALAEQVLKARGLSPDLIGLGRMLTHSRPEMRASVAAMLARRDDIDPVIWLMRLSEDPDEFVRLKAVEAFAAHRSPEVIQRLREMAAADDSAAVRAAAARLAPAETTAALPPLPGSPSLSPRAN